MKDAGFAVFGEMCLKLQKVFEWKKAATFLQWKLKTPYPQPALPQRINSILMELIF